MVETGPINETLSCYPKRNNNLFWLGIRRELPTRSILACAMKAFATKGREGGCGVSCR